jgi:hypothetical protein
MHLLEGCRDSLRPVGVLEEELVYTIAITLLQTHRLHRREKELSLEHMKEVDCFSSLEEEHVGEQINAIMDGRGAELRLEITLLDDLITNLETLLNDSAEMALGDDDAQHLLDSIIGANVSRSMSAKVKRSSGHSRKAGVLVECEPRSTN